MVRGGLDKKIEDAWSCSYGNSYTLVCLTGLYTAKAGVRQGAETVTYRDTRLKLTDVEVAWGHTPPPPSPTQIKGGRGAASSSIPSQTYHYESIRAQHVDN